MSKNRQREARRPPSTNFEPARTIEEWRDVPVEFVLWKISDEEDRILLSSLAQALQVGRPSADIVERGTSRLDEPIEKYRTRLEVRVTSRRAYGTAAWDVIVNVIGVVSGVMGIGAGTVAGARYVSNVWKQLREKSAEHGHDSGVSITTPAAAALLVVAWLADEGNPRLAEWIEDEDTNITATDHGRYFVVSIDSWITNEPPAMYVISADGGRITEVKLASPDD